MGWSPKTTTTVTDRDDDGRPSAWVTETEPEFDVHERDNWYALWEYEQSLCPQCGRLRAICEDPEQRWNPQIDTCYAVASQIMHERKWRRRHEQTKPDSDGWHPTDGGNVWVDSDLPPDPMFGLKGDLESG